jgi:hypothetical protein
MRDVLDVANGVPTLRAENPGEDAALVQKGAVMEIRA